MKRVREHARFGDGSRRALGLLVLVAGALLLAQACGQGGKSTGPTGNSNVAVALKKTGAQLPTGCTGTVTATGPVTKTGTIDANGQVTIGGLIPGTYVFTAFLDCSPNGTFTGQSPPTQIVEGVNSVTIEITTAPIDVGVKCDQTSLHPGDKTTCHCLGNLITGGTPTWSWTGAPTGSSSKDPEFTFPSPGTFNIACIVSNGSVSKNSGSVAVVVNAVQRTLTVNVTLGSGATGTVSSNPAGINNCTAGSGTCSATFSNGQQVTLSASPGNGSSFTGFSGDCSGQTCTVTMDGNKTVGAAFAVATGTIQVTYTPLGERLRSAAQSRRVALLCEGCIDVTVHQGTSASGPVEGTFTVFSGPGNSQKVTVPAGDHTVSAFAGGTSCELTDSPKHVHVNAGETAQVTFNGFCD